MKNTSVKNKRHTYCNPLAIPDLPRGKDDWYPFERGMFSHENKPESVTVPDYRTISDPTVYYYDNKWYLYPSYGMAWVTEDFETWEHVRTEPYCPKYSPCITRWNGRFLLTSWNCPLYVGDSPTGPFTEMGPFISRDGTPFVPCDPCLFTDDDGRIYMYAFRGVDIPGREGEFISTVVGYELDRTNPVRVVNGPVTVIRQNTHANWWERQGGYNQDEEFGWVEGPHLLKHNGRYYMIYASPDTCTPNYCMAVYYSDEGPLTGFVCQKKNPLTYRINGLVKGAGHGCVEHGPGNTLWAFYTIPARSTHEYERRIGMDLVDVDENGELFCPSGVTFTPQYIPSENTKKGAGENSTHELPVNTRYIPTASSFIEGREPHFSSDESPLTWWQPSDDDAEPTLTFTLKQGTYKVTASRVWWKEQGLDYAAGVLPGPFKYIIEGYDGKEWYTLLDRSDLEVDLNIDYCDFDAGICKAVRIRIVGWPKGMKPGIVDFTVFGKRYVESIE